MQQLSNDARQAILSEFDSLEERDHNVDQRAINQFFLTSHCDKYVESLGDRERLSTLVLLPRREDEYQQVGEYIKAYYNKATMDLSQSNYLLRRWIKNEDR